MATEEPTQETEKPSLEPSTEQPQEFHCPKCGSVLTLVETPTGTTFRCPKCGRMVRPVERGGGEKVEEEKGVAPLNVEAREFIVKELLERLDSVYGITTKKVKPIAATVEDNPQIALNPTALYWHIKQLAGQANDYQLYLFISGLFNKLREKGLLRQPTPMPVMGMPQETQQPYPFMFPQQSMQQPFSPFMPFQQPRQPGLPRTTEEFEDFSERKTRVRRREEREQEEHELRMAKIRKEIESMGKPAKTESSTVVTIVEPMRDAEGNLMKDGKGNIVFRKITGPSDQVRGTTSEDPEERVFRKMKLYKDAVSSGITVEKIREIIKEEGPKEQEVKPLTEEKIKEISEGAAMSVVAVTQKEEKEERRHKELLDAVRTGSSSKVVEGYKADEYRLIGQGMEKLAEKEPVKIIIDGVERILRVEPTGKEVEKGAREGIFKRIHPKFVTEE